MKRPVFATNAVVFTICALLVAGCAGLIQKSGELMEGTAFDEKTTALYRSEGKPRSEIQEVLSRDGNKEIVISSDAYPVLKIRASLLSQDNSFSVTRMEFLSSHIHGWNEFTLALDGQGHLVDNNGKLTLELTQIETFEIISGRIRYKETRITGTDALTNLNHRRERILELVEFMKTREAAQNEKPQSASEKQFEGYWKPILFPELVSKNKRPPEYSEQTAAWVTGNDVKWNDNYTKNIFPEELRELRNSGALLRDWEEAISWIYFEYAKDEIFDYFNNLEFIRKK